MDEEGHIVSKKFNKFDFIVSFHQRRRLFNKKKTFTKLEKQILMKLLFIFRRIWDRGTGNFGRTKKAKSREIVSWGEIEGKL